MMLRDSSKMMRVASNTSRNNSSLSSWMYSLWNVLHCQRSNLPASEQARSQGSAGEQKISSVEVGRGGNFILSRRSGFCVFICILSVFDRALRAVSGYSVKNAERVQRDYFTKDGKVRSTPVFRAWKKSFTFLNAWKNVRLGIFKRFHFR